MGQSQSTQHPNQKRRSFLITPKRLIKLRRQTSSENSGARSQQDDSTQTQFEGESNYHETADCNVQGMCVQNQNNPHAFFLVPLSFFFFFDFFYCVCVCKNVIPQHFNFNVSRVEQTTKTKTSKHPHDYDKLKLHLPSHLLKPVFSANRHKETTHTNECGETAPKQQQQRQSDEAAETFSHDLTAREGSLSLIEENLLQQLRELIEHLLCGGDRIEGDIVIEIDPNEKILKIVPQQSSSVREDQELGNYFHFPL